MEQGLYGPLLAPQSGMLVDPLDEPALDDDRHGGHEVVLVRMLVRDHADRLELRLFVEVVEAPLKRLLDFTLSTLLEEVVLECDRQLCSAARLDHGTHDLTVRQVGEHVRPGVDERRFGFGFERHNRPLSEVRCGTSVVETMRVLS